MDEPLNPNRDSYLCYGPPGVGKSRLALDFERSLFIGRAVDIYPMADALGVPRPTLVTSILGIPEPLQWTIPFTIDVIEKLHAFWDHPNFEAVRNFYDAVYIDDISKIASNTKTQIEEEVRVQKTAHRFATKAGNPDSRRIFGAVGSLTHACIEKGGMLKPSLVVTGHAREACTDSDGYPVVGAVLMPTKKLGPHIMSSFGSGYLIEPHPDWMDPWSTGKNPFAGTMFARTKDPHWETRCRAGILQGRAPASLWAVTQLANVRNRRYPGRECLDDFAFATAEQASKIMGSGASVDFGETTRRELALWVRDVLRPLASCGGNPPPFAHGDWRLDRYVFQQGFALHVLKAGRRVDPLDQPMPKASDFREFVSSARPAKAPSGATAAGVPDFSSSPATAPASAQPPATPATPASPAAPSAASSWSPPS